jgi:hypothetical protein
MPKPINRRSSLPSQPAANTPTLSDAVEDACQTLAWEINNAALYARSDGDGRQQTIDWIREAARTLAQAIIRQIKDGHSQIQ